MEKSVEPLFRCLSHNADSVANFSPNLLERASVSKNLFGTSLRLYKEKQRKTYSKKKWYPSSNCSIEIFLFISMVRVRGIMFWSNLTRKIT